MSAGLFTYRGYQCSTATSRFQLGSGQRQEAGYSVDLNVRTFHEILQMLDGYVDIILGGPPCSTVSRARHNRRRSGPRPATISLVCLGKTGSYAVRRGQGERG